MTDIELLPCPFCGRDEHLQVEHLEGTVVHPAYRVSCDNCGASTGYTDKDCRAVWNERANKEPLIAENERLRAEREVIVAEAVKYADKSGRLEARAERLAEALRRAEGLLRSAGIIAESDLERPHSAATEIKNALRDHDQDDEK